MAIQEFKIGDNIMAYFNSETGYLDIQGSGAMTRNLNPFESIKSLIKNATIGNGITTISDNLFQRCINLTTLEIGGDVTTIYGASIDNVGLEVLHLPNNIVSVGTGGVSNCPNLIDISISDNLKVYPSNFLRNCPSLKSIKIGSNVTTIGSGFLRDCKSLTRIINMSKKNQTVSGTLELGHSLDVKVGGYPTNTNFKDYVLANPNTTWGDLQLIVQYKFNTIDNVMPTFNSEFTGFATSDVDNGDGTTTRTIEHDTLLPTVIKFANMPVLEVLEANTSNVTSMESMFNGCSSLTYVNSSNWDTSKVTTMANMFSGCSALTSLDVSNWDTSKVNQMNNLFGGTKIKTVDLSKWDFSNVTLISGLFYGSSITEVPRMGNGDLNKATNMSTMFYSCRELVSADLSYWKTESVTNLQGLFKACSKLTSVNAPNLNTSKVTSMVELFNGCSVLTSIDVSGWDTSNVESMSSMFNDCNNLQTVIGIEDWDTSKVTTISTMFQRTSIVDIDLSKWETDNLVTAYAPFCWCSKLRNVDLSNWNLTNTVHIHEFFYGSSLNSVKLNGWNIPDEINSSNFFSSKVNEVHMLECSIGTINKLGAELPMKTSADKGVVYLEKVGVDEDLFQNKFWDIEYVILPPKQITGLKVTVENSRNVLSWNADIRVTSYKVFVDSYELVSTTETKYTLTTEYNNEFTVVGLNEAGSSPISEALHVKTEPNKPLATTVSHGDDVNGYNFSVSFVDDSNIETSYIIRYKVDNKSSVDITLPSANKGDVVTRSFSVASILDKIDIRVIAKNNIGESNFVEPIIFYMSATPRCAYDVYKKDAIISWQDRFENEQRYAIRYKINEEDVYRYDYIDTEQGLSGTLIHRIPLDEVSVLDVSIASISNNETHLFSRPVRVSKALDKNTLAPKDFIYDWVGIGEVEFTWEDIYTEEQDFELALNLDGVVTNVVIPSTSVDSVGNMYRYVYKFDGYGQLTAKVRMRYDLAKSLYSNEHMIVYREVSGLPPSYIKRTPTSNGYSVQWEAQEYVHKYELHIKENDLLRTVDTQYDNYDLLTNNLSNYELCVKTYFVGGVVSDFSDVMIFTPTVEKQDNTVTSYYECEEDYPLGVLCFDKDSSIAYDFNSLTWSECSMSDGLETKFYEQFQIGDFCYEMTTWGKGIEQDSYIHSIIKTLEQFQTDSRLVTLSFEPTTEGYRLGTEIRTACAMDYPVIADISKMTIVTIGDSITSGHPNFWAETMTGDEKSQYQYWLNRRLKGQFNIHNKGYGSDTTDKMLARFDRDVLSVYCQYCIIQGGTNDLYWAMAESNGDQVSLDRRLQTMKDNIVEMVKRCWDNNIIPVVGTLIPRTGATGIYKTALYDYNEWIINYCTVNDNIFYIDFFNAGKDNVPPTPLEDPTNAGALNPIYDGENLPYLNLLNC